MHPDTIAKLTAHMEDAIKTFDPNGTANEEEKCIAGIKLMSSLCILASRNNNKARQRFVDCLMHQATTLVAGGILQQFPNDPDGALLHTAQTTPELTKLLTADIQKALMHLYRTMGHAV